MTDTADRTRGDNVIPGPFPGVEGHQPDTSSMDADVEEAEATAGASSTEPRHADIDGTKINGAELLDRVKAAFEEYVVFGEHDAVACTLHAAATHGQVAWHHATRLLFTSPHKRCGKSRAQDIHAELSHNPLITANISVAALVRMINEADPPTLHLDEADAVFGRRSGDAHEDLRGILNAGFQRGRPYVRWSITQRAPEALPTFCMATLAGIGDMPDTIEDRAVVIHMRRRAQNERLPKPYRIRRDRPALAKLSGELNAWVRAHLGVLADAVPDDLPVEDRDADKWEPLIAVADLAGGDWPARARRACKELTSGSADQGEDLGTRLLADLYHVFHRERAEALKTTDLVGRLHALDEAPWPEHGKSGLTAANLAELLRPYGVKSKQARWTDGTNVRGYFRRDDRDGQAGLDEVWARYGACRCDDCR